MGLPPAIGRRGPSWSCPVTSGMPVPAAIAGCCRLSPRLPPRSSHQSAEPALGSCQRVSFLTGDKGSVSPRAHFRSPGSARLTLKPPPVRCLCCHHYAWHGVNPAGHIPVKRMLQSWHCHHQECFRKVGQFHIRPRETNVPCGFHSRHKALEWCLGTVRTDYALKALALGRACWECLSPNSQPRSWVLLLSPLHGQNWSR